jgi:hypothetical protein
MRTVALALGAMLSIATVPLDAAVPVTLRGSPESMVRQNRVAKQSNFTFVRSASELEALERSGELVRLEGNADYDVADFVTWKLARPEMRVFVERLAAQYREATGEKLVVTSLIRPSNRQPRNSHALSVHPTGMALDLRVSQRAASRQWLENTLISLERQGLLDATREHSPPHYHIALFTEPYMAHVERLEAARAEQELLAAVDDRALEAAAMAELANVGNALVDGAATAERSREPMTGGKAAAIVLVTAVMLLGWRVRDARARK